MAFGEGATLLGELIFGTAPGLALRGHGLEFAVQLVTILPGLRQGFGFSATLQITEGFAVDGTVFVATHEPRMGGARINTADTLVCVALAGGGFC